MRELDLVELNKRAKAITEKGMAQKKARYRYARDMGFTPIESVILQNRSEGLIKKLADERRLKLLSEGE